MSSETIELRPEGLDVRESVATVPDPVPDPLENVPPPLDLFGIHKTWRKTKHPVLKGIDLTLESGSLTWIGGRNGAGKTTLLRVAGGLIGCEQGHVLAYGLSPERHRREFQRRVAFLSAGNTGMYARLTVRIQLDTWARIAFMDRAARPAAVQRTLEDFALLDLADARCDRISMGQRQRVRLAMTFVSAPDLVMLDEPGTSLDHEGHECLRAAVQRIRERGGAVLWISPSGDDPSGDFTDRYMLEDGRLRDL